MQYGADLAVACDVSCMQCSVVQTLLWPVVAHKVLWEHSDTHSELAKAASCSRVGADELGWLFPYYRSCFLKPVDFPWGLMRRKERAANLNHLFQKPVVNPVSSCWQLDYV